MSAPVNVFWKFPAGEQSEIGLTRDISSKGLFIYSPSELSVGKRVRVEVLVRGSSEKNGSNYLEGQGKVVRVERKADRAGFAAAVQLHQKLSGREDKVVALLRSSAGGSFSMA